MCKSHKEFQRERLKVIPRYRIPHLYRAWFQAWLVRARAHKKMVAFSLRLDLAIEVNRHFLKKENGNLSFFPDVFNWVNNFSM